MQGRKIKIVSLVVLLYICIANFQAEATPYDVLLKDTLINLNSIKQAQEAIKYSKLIKDKKLEAQAYKNISLIYRNRGNYNQALHYLKKESKLLNKLDSVILEKAWNLNRIGEVLYLKGDYFVAFKKYYDCLDIFIGKEDKKGIFTTYLNIALLYFDIGSYEESLKAAKKTLDYATTYNDNFLIIRTLICLSDVYSEMNMFDKSIDYIEKAMEYSLISNSDNDIALVKLKLGNVLFKQQRYNQAIEEQENALSIFERINHTTEVANANYTLGKNLFNIKQNKKSLKYALKSYDIASRINNKNIKKKTSNLLGNLYSDKKDFKKAYKYHNTFKILNDSLLSRKSDIDNFDLLKLFNSRKEKQKKLHEAKIRTQNTYVVACIITILLLSILLFMFVQFYNDNKKSNKKLQFNNKLIEEQKKELVEALNRITDKKTELTKVNDIKNKLFSIISNDLNVPFSSIYGLTQLLNDKYSSLTEEQIIEYIIQINESSDYILKLLKNLLDWSNVQSGKIEYNPSPINISDVFENIGLKNYYIIKDKKIKLNNNIEDDLFVYADNYMLLSIVQNIIFNSIKYSNVSGRITINAKTINTNLLISVADNGVGISLENIDDIFSSDIFIQTKGTKNEPGTGLGLVLTKNFIMKNGGKIWVESKENKGSTFYFTLPLAK